MKLEDMLKGMTRRR